MSGSTIFRFMALMAVFAIAYARCPTTTQKPTEKPHVHTFGDNGKEKDAIPEEIASCRDAKRGDFCTADRFKGFCEPVGNCDNDKCQLRCTPRQQKEAIPDTNCRNATRFDFCIVDNGRGYCDRVGNCDNDQCQLRCTPIKQRVEKVYDISNY